MVDARSRRTVLLATTLPAGADNDRPRTDIDLLEMNPATTVVPPPQGNWTRKIENLAAADVRHVLKARSLHPTDYVSFTERIGAPAVLLDRRARHICVAHNFNRQRQVLERATGWMRRTEKVVVVSRRQEELLTEHGLRAESLVYVPDYVDTMFYDPARVVSPPPAALDLPVQPFVLAVGQEQRDYELLLGALQDTAMHAVLVPSSSWVRTSDLPSTLPARVSIRTGLSYPDLRALYSAAAMVVVPVKPGTQYAAGVNGLLEALAMARPVIVTETPGLHEYLDDRVMHAIPAGDRAALAEGLRNVADRAEDPARCSRIRGHVLRTHSVEAYAERLVSLIDG